MQWVSVAGVFLAWTACALLCLGGLILAVFSISGTWLVLGAALGAALLTGPGEFPGWPALLAFFAVCAAVDVIEWFAAAWGVRRRGGSAAAGWFALLGSLGGAILGGMVVPVLGSLVGMLLGSFALVYLAERRRLKKNAPAAHIARGAVLAGISVLLLKVAATAALVLALAAGLLLSVER
ncbi:MAG: DUF456 domain-containing protein [Spartobacteria bacterium]|nr:DUF456 domain-containing protein [Spartobacteria bacterium]